MQNRNPSPELSIIVPALNEELVIRGLVHSLSLQKGVSFELLLCDGGSIDGTREACLDAAAEAGLPARIIASKPGRARQMNAGAAASEGDFLLFLHADSLFPDPLALSDALGALRESINSSGHERVAGRFRLSFRDCEYPSPLFYYYHETKARLDRPGCIHGDQGFMLHRSLFESAGTFSESQLVLEDTRFAETVREKGCWILFPGSISTSARRFETEGRGRREILNAMIMTLSMIGRDDFLMKMRGAYAVQRRTERLRLHPFFFLIYKLLRALRFRERLHFWFRCGGYVAGNAWQVPFFLDVRRKYIDGIPAGEGKMGLLAAFERNLAEFHRWGAVRLAASFLVWIWFHAMLIGGWVRQWDVCSSPRRCR